MTEKASALYVPPVIKHDDWDDAPERVVLFSIERGDEEAIEYTMPAKPHAGLALAFLRQARLHGTEIAMSWLLEEAIGEAGYMALAAEPDAGDALLPIMMKCRDVVLGGLSAPKG
tara:strand:+ start:556 stop:900 length:345 start_codon:yes stop_codon:yes gene_type:complete